MSESIVIALITAGFPVIATAITAYFQYRINARNAAKQSILQMIAEDQLAVLYREMPTNYQNILHEYDIYAKNGGNSYVKKKVDEYIAWFDKTEKEMSRGKR